MGVGIGRKLWNLKCAKTGTNGYFYQRYDPGKKDTNYDKEGTKCKNEKIRVDNCVSLCSYTVIFVFTFDSCIHFIYGQDDVKK